MRYGFVIPVGNAGEQVAMARELEAAGWDGVFVADGVYGMAPWVALGAMAAVTTRVRLGTLLTPVSRRRPWTLASEVATLDHLSNGRAVLPVGLGAIDTGFAAVGEATDRATRAQLLDEGLEVVTRFWRGKPFRFDGRHYHVEWSDMRWAYAPVQSPRVPIWTVAAWPNERSMARALRWDGVLPNKKSAEGAFETLTPEDVRAICAYIGAHREQTTPYEIVVEGVSAIGDQEQAADTVRPFAEAGATWWIESMWEAPGGMEEVRRRIMQGPPRVE